MGGVFLSSEREIDLGVTAVVHPVADQMENHLIDLAERARLGEMRQQFVDCGVVRIPFIAPAAVKELLSTEVEELITSYGRRQDVVFSETGNIKRSMCNVRRDQIDAFGSIIPGAVFHARPA